MTAYWLAKRLPPAKALGKLRADIARVSRVVGSEDVRILPAHQVVVGRSVTVLNTRGDMIPADRSFAQAVDEFQHRVRQYDWSSQSSSRRQIAEVFLRLALAHGFSSVSMRMIAQEIGIRASTIYAHFPHGRDEIVEEMVRWHFHKFGTAVLDAVAGAHSPEEAISIMTAVHLRRQLQLPETDMWDLLIATDRMVHFLPSRVSAEAAEQIRLYEQLYRCAASEMGFSDSGDAVRILMTLLDGAGRWCSPEEFEAHPEKLLDRTSRLTRAVLELYSHHPNTISE